MTAFGPEGFVGDWDTFARAMKVVLRLPDHGLRRADTALLEALAARAEVAESPVREAMPRVALPALMVQSDDGSNQPMTPIRARGAGADHRIGKPRVGHDGVSIALRQRIQADVT